MLKHLEFSINIKATKAAIWKALWDEQLYREWIGVFGEGSFYKIENWELGNKIMFLGPDQSGIYSIIEKYIPNKSIQFKHIGTVINGEMQEANDESKKWTGATESYSLIDGVDSVQLLVEIDILDEHVEFMSSKFPLALEVVKKNSV